FLFMLAPLAAALWAMLVWYREGPDRRSYHWSLPVARPKHDLARVVAGAVYLLGICAVLAGAGALASFAEGELDRLTALGPQLAACLFVGPLIAYALVSAVVLWGDAQLVRWLLGLLLGVAVLAEVLDANGYTFLVHGFQRFLFDERFGLATALTMG